MSYNTEQRKLLLGLFNSLPHAQLTVKQIQAALPEGAISISAIYRNLAAMTKEGSIRQLTKADSREKCYQYLNQSCCQGEIHLTCTHCGKTFHLEHMVADRLQNTLGQEGFQIDKGRTVLYGTCRSCTGSQKDM